MTPAERVAFDRIIAVARRLVRCADEFGDDYPEACGEDMQALDEAQAEYGRVCDAMAVEPVRLEFMGVVSGVPVMLVPCDGFVAPAGNPGARVVESGR